MWQDLDWCPYTKWRVYRYVTKFGPCSLGEQPHPQGFSLKKWVGAHPFFKGKALGMRLLGEGFFLIEKSSLRTRPISRDLIQKIAFLEFHPITSSRYYSLSSCWEEKTTRSNRMNFSQVFTKKCAFWLNVKNLKHAYGFFVKIKPTDMRMERLFQESHFRAYKVSRILNFR